MSNLGDFKEDYPTLNTKFTTVDTAGIPTVLAGTPVISVYKANGTTQSVAGITLTVDFDGIVGNNHVLIDLSSDAFYAIGNDYQIVITTGTVDGGSVVGYVVEEFSIENRFGLTDTEIEQIRHRLNLDGTQSAPTAGGAAKMAGTDADHTLNSQTIVRTTPGNAVTHQANNGGFGQINKGNGNNAGMRNEGGTGGTSAAGLENVGGAGTNAPGISNKGGDGTPGGPGIINDGSLGSGPDVDGAVFTSNGDGRDISAKELFVPQYPEGGIFFDSTAPARTTTRFGIDGTSEFPVTSAAAAVTLASNALLGRKKIFVLGGTLALGSEDVPGFSIEGLVGGLGVTSLSNSDVAFTEITNLDVALGTDTAGVGGVNGPVLNDCRITNTSTGVTAVGATEIKDTTFAVNTFLENTAAGTMRVERCSTLLGAELEIFGSNGGLFDVVLFTGNLKLSAVTTAITQRVQMNGGIPTIDASCTTGKLVLTGWGSEIVDNSGGGFTVDSSGYQTLPATTLVAFQKNKAFPNFPIYMVDDTDHPVGKPGLTVAGTTSKDGAGSLTPLTNAITELGFGFYRVDLTAAEINGDVINLRFTASGASDRVVSFPTNV